MPYETALIMVYGTHFQNESCGSGENQELEVSSQVRVTQNPVNGELEIQFETPPLAGNRFYCALVERDQHLLCTADFEEEEEAEGRGESTGLLGGDGRNVSSSSSSSSVENGNNGTTKAPSLCHMKSLTTLYLENRPFIYRYIPYCTSHFRCGWIYILVVGAYLPTTLTQIRGVS